MGYFCNQNFSSFGYEVGNVAHFRKYHKYTLLSATPHLPKKWYLKNSHMKNFIWVVVFGLVGWLISRRQPHFLQTIEKLESKLSRCFQSKCTFEFRTFLCTSPSVVGSKPACGIVFDQAK